jgi:transcriptional regulator with XRE-family HTH domain
MVKRQTPRLMRLFARVRRLTNDHGSKQKLADALGVVAPRLSEWLRGAVEPGGESTLHLLEWVTEKEAKLKDPDRALTQSGRKTQSAKSTTNEKVQSDHPQI